MTSEKQNKVLFLISGDDERKVVLNKAKITIGRDKDCDVVLDDESISRKHALIHFKHEEIYIENISSSGQILKNNTAIEYSNLESSDEIKFGAWTLYWRLENAQTEEISIAEPISAPEAESISEPELVPMPEAEPEINLGIMPMEQEAEESFAPVSVEANTVAAAQIGSARLKVIRGDDKDKEIRLDFGSVWIVGRSPKNQVQIDSPKLSRQHFKILKIGAGWRVQDMGSANGTRVNGVRVEDAPLYPFDVISAGPVELQFMIVDAALPKIESLEAPAVSQSPGFVLDPSLLERKEEANFLAPAIRPLNSNTNAGPQIPSYGSTFSSAPSISAVSAAPRPQKPDEDSKLKVWWENSNPRQKTLAALAGLFIILGASLQMMPEEATQSPAQTVANQKPIQAPEEAKRAPASTDTSAPAKTSAAEETKPAHGIEIENKYLQAEKAYQSEDWNLAFQLAKEIQDKVGEYKNIKEILSKAQNKISEDNIGRMTKDPSNLDEAAKQNSDTLELLLQEAKKSLSAEEWDRATEIYTKALNLAPDNTEALDGYAASMARNSNLKAADLADINSKDASSRGAYAFESNSLEQDLEKERTVLLSYKDQFSDAKNKMQSGDFTSALSILKNLNKKVQDQSESITELIGRAPASTDSSELKEGLKLFQSNIRDALDTSITQLKAEYQTQLADAEAYTNNRQFVEAREIFDRILKQAPELDEVQELRTRLYSRMIAEAKTLYLESLVYESVGDTDNAKVGLQKTTELLTSVDDSDAEDYLRKAKNKLKRLQR